MTKGQAKKIICISGLMGSGKSTAAEFLQRRLGGNDCELIIGDSFNQAVMEALAAEGVFEEVLGIPFNPKTFREDGIRISESSPEGKGKEKVEHIRILFDQRVGELISEEVERLKQQSNAEFIIVEHRGAVSFKMWDQADKRIIVDVDEKIRIERLANREFSYIRANPNPSAEDFRKFEVNVKSLLAASPEETKAAIDKMVENGEGSGIIRNNGTKLEYEFAVENCIDNYMQELITGHKAEQQKKNEPTSEPFNRDEMIAQTIERFRERFNEILKTEPNATLKTESKDVSANR